MAGRCRRRVSPATPVKPDIGRRIKIESHLRHVWFIDEQLDTEVVGSRAAGMTTSCRVQFLVVACLWKRKNKAYVSYPETRTALRAVNDAARSHALWFLGNLV